MYTYVTYFTNRYLYGKGKHREETCTFRGAECVTMIQVRQVPLVIGSWSSDGSRSTVIT